MGSGEVAFGGGDSLITFWWDSEYFCRQLPYFRRFVSLATRAEVLPYLSFPRQRGRDTLSP